MKTKTIRNSIPAIFLALLVLFGGAAAAKAAGALFEPANFVLIRGGEFTMGSPEGEVGRGKVETQHQVRVSTFAMSKYAVTVAEFRRFVEASGYQTDAEKQGNSINWRYGVYESVRPQSEENHPVLYVSWNDAVAYCKWLSTKTGKHFRLPTEAEREYACRAGSRTPFNTGENLTTDQANYDGKYPYNNNPQGVNRKNTFAVYSFAPKAWCLYNMHGNVYEWCSDWYSDTYYDDCKANGTVTNPPGPASAPSRLQPVHVIRGGSWYDYAVLCRSAYRDFRTPDSQYDCLGFRLVFVP